MFVVGTARNISSSWTSVQKSLEIILDALIDYECIIIESNSSDNTLQLLHDWSKNKNITVLSLGFLKEKERTKRIATCRNKYMEVIHDSKNTYKYTLIIDLDESLQIEKDFKNQLDTCFLRSDWDAVASNRRGKYYDIWALRSKTLEIEYDCWEMVKKFGNRQKYVHNHQKIIPTTGDWIECDSAFGCMVLYKTNSIISRKYNGNITCEHVSFHQGLKMFINPAFISGGISKDHIR
jgi:glycosyltransferase involved in cell wall biosynthesis